MEKIDLKSFYLDSFVDNTIVYKEIDYLQKSITIKTNGAYLDDEDSSVLFKSEILIKNWHKLKVIQREGDNIKTLKELPSEFLTSIIEFHYSEDELKLVGLGYNCWIEWIFTKPEVTIYGEVEEGN